MSISVCVVGVHVHDCLEIAKHDILHPKRSWDLKYRSVLDLPFLNEIAVYRTPKKFVRVTK